MLESKMPDQNPKWFPTDTEVTKALTVLGIKKSTDLAKDFGGCINRIFRYTDQNGKECVLRIRPRWMTEKRISFEHALAMHLVDKGLPLCLPKSFNGKLWIKYDDIFYDIYPFVKGCQGKPVPKECKIAGQLLAKFHLGSQDFDKDMIESPAIQNQFPPDVLKPRINKLRALINGKEIDGAFYNGDKSIFDVLWQEWENTILVYYPKDIILPEVIRHGDFHLWNILFSDNPLKIEALLDLDMVALGPRAFDISYAVFFLRHALVAWHGEKGLDVHKWKDTYDALFSGYSEATSENLSDSEVSVMPAMIQCIAINFMLGNMMKVSGDKAITDIFNKEYVNIVDWLKKYWPILSDIIRKRF